MTHVPKDVRDAVRKRAQHCCGYCLVGEADFYFTFHLDHVISEKHRGLTELGNLALSCPDCNAYKGADIGANDPNTGELVRLFNPRTQTWGEHFVIQDDGMLLGLTPEGRATVELLQINSFERIEQRAELIGLGLYPRLS